MSEYLHTPTAEDVTIIDKTTTLTRVDYEWVPVGKVMTAVHEYRTLASLEFLVIQAKYAAAYPKYFPVNLFPVHVKQLPLLCLGAYMLQTTTLLNNRFSQRLIVKFLVGERVLCMDVTKTGEGEAENIQHVKECFEQWFKVVEQQPNGF